MTITGVSAGGRDTHALVVSGFSRTLGDDRTVHRVCVLRTGVAHRDPGDFERGGEAKIARDAAALRGKALKRIAALET